MPLLIISILIALGLGFTSGYLTLDLSGTNRQEEQTLVEQIPATETVVIEPTPSPTPTPKPQVVYKQPETTPKPTTNSNESNPIVNCKAPPDSPCTGQSLKIKKSECLTRGINICCQTNSGWRLLSTGECNKTQDSEIASQEAEINKLQALLAKRKAVEGNSDKMAEREKWANDLIEKSRKDLEDFRNLSRSTVDSSIKDMEETRRRWKEEIEASIKELNSRIKESEIKQKKEFYDLCAGNVFTKYDTYPSRLRIERNNSLVKQYEDELAQCAFLYK